MSDLDDEELEATRRLNGVARKKDKERTDTNVGNIEKDIKRCEELIKPEHANWIGISNQLAIAHVVDRVKELEEKNKTLKNFTSSIFNGDVTKDFIPVQKVKDKIEELKEHYNTDNNIRIYTLKGSYELQVAVLQELLEDK